MGIIFCIMYIKSPAFMPTSWSSVIPINILSFFIVGVDIRKQQTSKNACCFGVNSHCEAKWCVTTCLIVIPSKSYKFFGRQLPWSVFRFVRNVPSFVRHSIRQNSSFFSRDFLPNHHLSGRRQTSAKPLIYGTFWTFRCLLPGCITRRKGTKKPHAVT